MANEQHHDPSNSKKQCPKVVAQENNRLPPKNSMLHVASKSTAAQELDLGSFETKIALRVAMPSKGLESKASPNKNWTWVASGTKFSCGVLV